MNRRDFLVAAAAATAGAMIPERAIAAVGAPAVVKRPRMEMRFFPYELKLRHAFNLARNSQTTTPDVQVEISYDGMTGYGEASMPPYLGESVDSVTGFLGKVDLGQFSDPFLIEDIHDYLDGIAEGNCAAKAAVDIALHDLTGKLMG